MALTPVTFTSAFQSAGAGIFTGVQFPSLCVSLGNAFYTWAMIPGNVPVTGVSTGLLGVGTVTGTLALAPNPGLVLSVLKASGLNGVTAPQMAQIISGGLSLAMSTAQYSGPSAGVGVGVDSSSIPAANPFTLATLLAPSFPGPTGPLFSNAVANASVALLATTVGVGAVAGTIGATIPVAGPTPASIIF